jgi:GNAT superfamily N-acetyltransferase
MAVVTVRFAQRPELWDRIPKLFAGVLPEYNLHGDVMKIYWGRLFAEFPHLQLALYDDKADEVLAVARSLPGTWDGTAEDLNRGLDAAIEAGFAPGGDEPNVLCALGIEVSPQHQGKGLSKAMLRELTRLAASLGHTKLIVPVRPTWKERYPLTPITRYAAWTTSDGLPFDPWIRTQVKLGGVVTSICEHSSLITGKVTQWESWTGMAFPEDGTYVFPGGLSTLHINRTVDLGTYWEPGVWIVHEPVAAASC